MLKRLGLKFICCFFALIAVLGQAPTAFASIHTYPETDGQILYRSRLSVQDAQRQAWQLICFKRVQSGQVTEFKLRLVGFPGQVSLEHPASLSFEDSHGHQWTASDQTQEESQLESVLESVGQYDLLALMKDLNHAERMELTIKLTENEHRVLIVPQSMIKEWLMLKEM